MLTIRVKDFSEFPGGRYKRFGTDSGEEFRETVLIDALDATDSDGKLEVDLSDIFTYQPSFLDEAFAGLIKLGIISADEFKKKFVFKADSANEPYIDMIMRYVNEAASRKTGRSSAH
jgi:hypothetical protein